MRFSPTSERNLRVYAPDSRCREAVPLVITLVCQQNKGRRVALAREFARRESVVITDESGHEEIAREGIAVFGSPVGCRQPRGRARQLAADARLMPRGKIADDDTAGRRKLLRNTPKRGDTLR